MLIFFLQETSLFASVNQDLHSVHELGFCKLNDIKLAFTLTDRLQPWFENQSCKDSISQCLRCAAPSLCLTCGSLQLKTGFKEDAWEVLVLKIVVRPGVMNAVWLWYYLYSIRRKSAGEKGNTRRKMQIRKGLGASCPSKAFQTCPLYI